MEVWRKARFSRLVLIKVDMNLYLKDDWDSEIADILFAIFFFFVFWTTIRRCVKQHSGAYRHHYNSLDPDNHPIGNVVLNDYLLDDIYYIEVWFCRWSPNPNNIAF